VKSSKYRLEGEEKTNGLEVSPECAIDILQTLALHVGTVAKSMTDNMTAQADLLSKMDKDIKRAQIVS